MTSLRPRSSLVTIATLATSRWLFCLLSLCCAPVALATWSIIAVDRETGEIGIAGASCTFDVSGVASVVPGKGAIVVQAASNYFARMQGVKAMSADESLDQIMAVMQAEGFEPERQQYGVILLAGDQAPAVASGSQIQDWSGSTSGSDVAVMGNILVGEAVIEHAFAAFELARDRSLSDRLMKALIAGAEAGGDKRCGAQHARSAFLFRYDPVQQAIITLSIQGVPLGGQSAVKLLKLKAQQPSDSGQ